MEIRDLYNKDRIFSGKTIIKGDKVPKDLYYLVVFAVIEDDGKYLIQKRSAQKGSKWAFTSGHPLQGEDSLTGLIREVKEELNLDIKNENIKLIKTIMDDIHIVDVYYIKMHIDINKIKIQLEELEDYKIVSPNEIEDIINQNKFHEKHARMYHTLKELNKKSG